jgi:G:T-mismatch repair DNA endonuclease (very short patch repair protein)
LGWRRLVVWECELKAPARLSKKLRRFLCIL